MRCVIVKYVSWNKTHLVFCFGKTRLYYVFIKKS